jgi:hypothetical protein
MANILKANQVAICQEGLYIRKGQALHRLELLLIMMAE